MGLTSRCIHRSRVRAIYSYSGDLVLLSRVLTNMYRSYQLQADVPTGGTTSGALVHFTENTMGPNQSTTTPWIAYISCDLNETNASQEDGESDRGPLIIFILPRSCCAKHRRYLYPRQRSWGGICCMSPIHSSTFSARSL